MTVEQNFLLGGIALMFAGVGVYCLHRIMRLDKNEKFRLFWLAPFAAAGFITCFAMLTNAFGSGEACNCTPTPNWMATLTDLAAGLFFGGLIINRAAPEGKLLPDIPSLATCIGSLLLWASPHVSHAYQDYLLWTGIIALFWLGIPRPSEEDEYGPRGRGWRTGSTRLQ